jgi:hypothetical protein
VTTIEKRQTRSADVPETSGRRSTTANASWLATQSSKADASSLPRRRRDEALARAASPLSTNLTYQVEKQTSNSPKSKTTTTKTTATTSHRESPAPRFVLDVSSSDEEPATSLAQLPQSQFSHAQDESNRFNMSSSENEQESSMQLETSSHSQTQRRSLANSPTLPTSNSPNRSPRSANRSRQDSSDTSTSSPSSPPTVIVRRLARRGAPPKTPQSPRRPKVNLPDQSGDDSGNRSHHASRVIDPATLPIPLNLDNSKRAPNTPHDSTNGSHRDQQNEMRTARPSSGASLNSHPDTSRNQTAVSTPERSGLAAHLSGLHLHGQHESGDSDENEERMVDGLQLRRLQARDFLLSRDIHLSLYPPEAGLRRSERLRLKRLRRLQEERTRVLDAIEAETQRLRLGRRRFRVDMAHVTVRGQRRVGRRAGPEPSPEDLTRRSFSALRGPHGQRVLA